MSQGDQSIANQAGASFRADLNGELQALVSLSSGASAPGTTYAYQLWADTTTNTLKRRNAANSAWIVVRTLDESFLLSRSSNTILGLSDIGKTISATSTFTQTLTAVATLADGWWINYRNDGTGIITLDPNASETINGATTLALYPGESCIIIGNGSAFKTVGLSTGWVEIAAATPSSAATVDFTGLTGFYAYRFELDAVLPATNAADLFARISQDNGSTFKSGGTNYRWALNRVSDAAAAAAFGSTGTTGVQLTAGGVSNVAGGGVTGWTQFADIANGASLSPFQSDVSFTDGTNWYRAGGIGVYVADATAINAARFFFGSGNVASGKIKVYGLRAPA